MAAFFSPDASFTVNNGAPAVGRSEITELAQSFMTTFLDLQVVMDDLRVRADCAEYHWTLIGTNTGPEALAIGFASAALKFGRWERNTVCRNHDRIHSPNAAPSDAGRLIGHTKVTLLRFYFGA